jgi:hypothetical protein
MLRTLFAGFLASAAIAGPAHAVQVCAWIDETIGDDDYHELKLWLEADGEADVLYKIKGEGLVNESSRGNAPNSGTRSCVARRPARRGRSGSRWNRPGAST